MPKAKLVTRSASTTSVTTDSIPKGSGLTNAELDSNFLNLRDQGWRLRADDSTQHTITADTQINFSGGTITTDANGDITISDLAGSGGTITALNNRVADRLTTIGATTSELDGEANLTFNGSLLSIGGSPAASFRVNGSTEIDRILDEDDLSSDHDNALATQQSIKAYVDDKLGDAETVATDNTSTISANRAVASIIRTNLTGNHTVASIQNFGTGLTITFVFRQDSSGNRTVAWTDTIIWAGGVNTLSTAANAVDVVTIFNDGVSLLGSINKDYN